VTILILGVNGFIGNSLVRAIVERTNWRVVGMDLACDKLEHSLGHPRFIFVEGDIVADRDWVGRQIRKSDVVVPLVAIATPMAYVKKPLEVFELTFEENLQVVRRCVEHGTRLVFPSTSEVYGMSEDPEFDEDSTRLELGPIHKQRWIYSCSKQLLDRVIWAYGQEQRLDFTLVRPFNWIGPRLDNPHAAREGSSRVVTQFISNLIHGEPIRLVDGGRQKRCFTYIDDGIDCLMKILDNPGGCCRGEIFNIGNPANECSMEQLAHELRRMFAKRIGRQGREEEFPIVEVTAKEYYGTGYEDILVRKPSVQKARRLLDWEPRIGLDESLERTLDACLADAEVDPASSARLDRPVESTPSTAAHPGRKSG